MKRKKTLIERVAITVIALTVISIIVGVILYGVVGVWLLQNPDTIGEWFGDLLNGAAKGN